MLTSRALQVTLWELLHLFPESSNTGQKLRHGCWVKGVKPAGPWEEGPGKPWKGLGDPARWSGDQLHRAGEQIQEPVGNSCHQPE